MATIIRKRKENTPIVITITSETTGSVIDISSNTIYFTVKTVKDTTTTDSTSIISKTQYITSGTSGQVSIALSSDDTDITPRQYVFDFWREQPSGDTRQLVEGTFVIEQPVTNRI